MNPLFMTVGILWIAGLLAHWRFLVIGRQLATATSHSAEGLKESECYLSWKRETMRRKLQAIQKGEFGAELRDVASRAIFFDNLSTGLIISAMLLVVTAMLVMNNR